MSTLVKLCLIVTFFAALVHISEQYGDGAPPEVCGDMAPQHGVPASPLPSPYSLTINKKKIKPGDKITVTIGSTSRTNFKGFFLQARDSTNAAIGTFEPANNAKLINCGLKKNNAATHTNASDKTRIVLYWNSPTTIKAPVKFLLTTVKAWDQFWVGQESEVITLA